MYTAVGGNEARGGALLLTWLEENYEAVRQFYGDTFVTNVKTMLRGFPEESSTEAEHQRLQARIDNEFAFNLFRAVFVVPDPDPQDPFVFGPPRPGSASQWCITASGS